MILNVRVGRELFRIIAPCEKSTYCTRITLPPLPTCQPSRTLTVEQSPRNHPALNIPSLSMLPLHSFMRRACSLFTVVNSNDTRTQKKATPRQLHSALFSSRLFVSPTLNVIRTSLDPSLLHHPTTHTAVDKEESTNVRVPYASSLHSTP